MKFIKLRTVSFLVILLLFADLFLKTISVEILFVLIIVIQFYFLNKYENSFILILFSSIIVGAFFISRGYRGVGGFAIILGVLLIRKDIIRSRKKIIREYIPLFLILVSFGLSAFLNHKGEFYDTKFYSIFIFGTLSYIAFAITFRNTKKIDFENLGLVFIIWGIYMIRLAIDINNLPGPNNLLAFDFMRQQTYIYDAHAIVDEDDFTISYHLPGFLSIVGLSFYFISNKVKTYKWTGFILIVVLFTILYSGGRQNLLGFLLLFLINIIIKKEYSFMQKASIIIASTVGSIAMLLSVKSDSIQRIVSSNSVSAATENSGRAIHYIMGWNYFLESKLTGIGIGLHDYGGKDVGFPHNLFIELLAEVGLIGTFFVFMFLIKSIIRNFYKIKLNNKYLLVLIPFFIRAMISGSLTTNIIVFSFIFALAFLGVYRSKNLKILNNEI